MPTERVNGAKIHYELEGDGGTSLVLVHGSWGDREQWNDVARRLAGAHRVLSFDRRGHSRSQAPATQGSIRDDVADVAALIERFDLTPACVVGNSFGGSITLRLAGERPDLLRCVSAHEPPLFSLVADDPAAAAALASVVETLREVLRRIQAGDHAGAAARFMRMALSPEERESLPDTLLSGFTANAPTFLDEASDPEQLRFEPTSLDGFDRPVLLTHGDRSPPMYVPVITRLVELFPSAERLTFSGAGHLPHVTRPEAYAEAIDDFVRRCVNNGIS